MAKTTQRRSLSQVVTAPVTVKGKNGRRKIARDESGKPVTRVVGVIMTGGAGTLPSAERAISDATQWRETRKARKTYDNAQDARYDKRPKRYAMDKLPGAAETWSKHDVPEEVQTVDPWKSAALVQAALASRQG